MNWKGSCSVVVVMIMANVVTALGQRNWDPGLGFDLGVESRVRIIIASENYYRSHHYGLDDYQSAANRITDDPDALTNWSRYATTIDTGFAFTSIDTMRIGGSEYVVYRAPASMQHESYVVAAVNNGAQVYRLMGFLHEGRSLDSAELVRFTRDAFAGDVTREKIRDLVPLLALLYFHTILRVENQESCVSDCPTDSISMCVDIDTVLTPDPLISLGGDVVADAEFVLRYFVQTSGQRVYLHSYLLGNRGLLSKGVLFWKVCEP